MKNHKPESKPDTVEQLPDEGLDETACSLCLDCRKLADDAMATLREIKEKYGLGDRHVMREKNREIEKLREALQFVATDKIANAADMRYRAARALEFRPENAGGMARELAAQKPESTNNING